MSISAVMMAALLGQSAFSLAVEAPPTDRSSDVAYEELANGHSDAAVHKLEASDAVHANDPAALINLGAAYAAVGKTDKAISTYRAAMSSSDRYDLQLADGSWMDSRLAAKTALQRLLSSGAQASR